MTITKDSSAPQIVVIGATGKQGGSVVDALEASKKAYRVKAITRDASKPAAKALADRGAEIAAATVSPDSKAKLTEVFQGADYVFSVTDFWQDLNKDREIKEGKATADAVKAAGVKTFIYSSLPSYTALSNGKYKDVDHFDSKHAVEEYAKSLGGFEYIGVQPACYTSNFLPGGGMHPQKQDDGSYVSFTTTGFSESDIVLLDSKADYGKFVVSAIESGKYKNGDVVFAASDVVKGKDIVAALEKSTGNKVNIVEVPPENWIEAVKPKMGPQVSREFGEMIAVHNEIGYFGPNVLDKIKADQANVTSKLTSLQDSIDAQKK